MRPIVAIVCVLACAAAGFLRAQITPTTALQSPRATAAPPSLLQAFQVGSGTVQSFAVPTGGAAAFDVELVLAGRSETLALAPYDLRRAGYQLLVDDGRTRTPIASGPCVTYRGALVGRPDSTAALVVERGQLRGIVHDGAQLWGIQPADQSDPRAARSLHVVYRAADGWNLPHGCGTTAASQPVQAQAGGADVVWNTDLALELDYPFAQLFASPTAAQNDALMVVNGMDAIYRRDCQIAFTVGTVLVRTGPDPYTSVDAGTLLAQYQNWWNTFQGPVARDVSMLFTGRALTAPVVGIAFVGQICNPGGAYGLTRSLFGGTATSVTSRVGLICHEMGHLWNAAHCDATADCRIMCSGLGGCTGTLNSFSAAEAAQITAFRNTVGCLTQSASPPTITSISPNSCRTFQPPQLTITGSGLTGVDQVTIGTQVFASGITVLSDSQLRVTPPEGVTIGPSFLRVQNTAGQSNALLFTWTETVPCGLSAPGAALGGSSLTFHFGGRAQRYWFLGLALQPTTALVAGFPVLSGFSGFTYGRLGPAGTGSFTTVVPPMLLNGITLYEQVLEYDPTTLQLTGSSNVASTRFFL